MRSVWILGDQLSMEHAALRDAEPNVAPGETRIVMIESWARLRSQRYHARKLVLLLSAMRHFAEELRQRGYLVDYRAGARDFTSALRAHVAEYAPDTLVVMEPNDWNGADVVRRLPDALGVPVTTLPDTLFLTPKPLFLRWARGRTRLVMDDFYREQRRRLRLLLTAGGKPLGGRWSLDAENRQGAAAARSQRFSAPPRYEPDALTREVIALVEREFPDAYGAVGDFALPVTRAGALDALAAFVEERLPLFGPFEDAMLTGEATLAHSMLTPALNLGLLTPAEALATALDAWERRPDRYPLNSIEGFVRQIAGWREFIRGMYWLKMPGYRTVNYFGDSRPLPDSWWTGATRLRCVGEAIRQVRATGYNHHIQRLMVLSNFALLAGVNPQQVNAWFRIAYLDAYEWVTLPNVLGMSLFADGGAFATKPYIGSGAYINRMSDYCAGCAYDPQQKTGPAACPFNYLYWDFLARHEDVLAANPRLGVMYTTLARKSAEERRAIAASAEAFLAGDEMTPNGYLA